MCRGRGERAGGGGAASWRAEVERHVRGTEGASMQRRTSQGGRHGPRSSLGGGVGKPTGGRLPRRGRRRRIFFEIRGQQLQRHRQRFNKFHACAAAAVAGFRCGALSSAGATLRQSRRLHLAGVGLLEPAARRCGHVAASRLGKALCTTPDAHAQPARGRRGRRRHGDGSVEGRLSGRRCERRRCCGGCY